jgi:DNA-binding transcriptional LysR family regulator
MSDPDISLEQWRALVAVVDAGGYAQAGALLHKSQSSVTYAVQKLQSLLGVKAFEVKGRKAVLTTTGQLLYRRGRALVGEAVELERAARKLSAGWEAEIGLAVEVLFPSWMLFRMLDRFGRESPHTRIEVYETVVGGSAEALQKGQVELAIGPNPPPGYLGDSLLRMRFVPAAHPEHPLHRLGRPLTARDLRKHRHLVVRDSASTRTRAIFTVDVDQRWTVSNMTSSILAARLGYGFAYYPEEKIREELATGLLKVLPMREGGERWVEIYLTFADRDAAGPGTRRLAEIIREEVAQTCKIEHAKGEAAARPGRAGGKVRSR